MRSENVTLSALPLCQRKSSNRLNINWGLFCESLCIRKSWLVDCLRKWNIMAISKTNRKPPQHSAALLSVETMADAFNHRLKFPTLLYLKLWCNFLNLSDPVWFEAKPLVWVSQHMPLPLLPSLGRPLSSFLVSELPECLNVAFLKLLLLCCPHSPSHYPNTTRPNHCGLFPNTRDSS